MDTYNEAQCVKYTNMYFYKWTSTEENDNEV